MRHLEKVKNTACGPGSSVNIATDYGLEGPGSNPGGDEIFYTCPDRPWGLPSLLCNGYRVFPGGRDDWGVGLNPHNHLVPKVLGKIRAKTLLTLRACVVYRNGENLPKNTTCTFSSRSEVHIKFNIHCGVWTNMTLWDVQSSICVCKSKGKAVTLQASRGPEFSRKLRLPDFMTTTQDGGKVVSLTHRSPLPPRKCSWYSFLLEGESTPGP